MNVNEQVSAAQLTRQKGRRAAERDAPRIVPDDIDRALVSTWFEGYDSAKKDPLWVNYIRELQCQIYTQNVGMGWWSKPRETGTCLMLIVSEIAEAMEGDRKSLMDDHLPHRPMIEVELADAIIRILDLAAHKNLDMAGAMREKLAYNRTRADHQPENRAKEGGKAY